MEENLDEVNRQDDCDQLFEGARIFVLGQKAEVGVDDVGDFMLIELED